jgi:hypothetical protein
LEIYIDIYDAGEKLGVVKTESNFKGEAVMELINGSFGVEQVKILHVRDMNYGIIIPNHIAKVMIDVCEEFEKGNKNEI